MSAEPRPALRPVEDPEAEVPAFRMRGLSLGYEDRTVVREVDLDIPHGATTVLIGANGCGKTTLLKGLSRQLRPVAGTLEADGRGVREWHARQYARSVSLLADASVALAQGELVQRRDAFDLGVGEERYLARCRLKTGRL